MLQSHYLLFHIDDKNLTPNGLFIYLFKIPILCLFKRLLPTHNGHVHVNSHNRNVVQIDKSIGAMYRRLQKTLTSDELFPSLWDKCKVSSLINPISMDVLFIIGTVRQRFEMIDGLEVDFT